MLLSDRKELSLTERITGWEYCSLESYDAAYRQFGGSVCTHPDVISFLNEVRGRGELVFKRKQRNGETVAAYFTSEGAATLLDKDYPIVFDDLIFPADQLERFILPVKSKRISPFHKWKIVNSFFTHRLKHKICYIKGRFSKPTIKKRNTELRQFLRQGGECRDISFFTNEELAVIYIDLFKARWGDTLRCFTYNKLIKIFHSLRHLLFGNVLLLNGKPCAYDLIFYSNCKRWIYFDDINGGYLQDEGNFALGSILLWSNILSAQKICEHENKKMIFSLGVLQGWPYKKQWCEIYPLGRTLTF